MLEVGKNGSSPGNPPSDGQYKIVPRWQYLLGKLIPGTGDGGGFDTQTAKDILSSDVTKGVARILIGLLPGGGAALSAMDTAGTVADAAGVANKIPKIR